MAGRTGGAVCTSSNAQKIMRWALAKKKKIFFVPDRHLGENAAAQVGILPERQFIWLGPIEAPGLRWDRLSKAEQAQCDSSQLILWGGYCGVHTVFSAEQVNYWHGRDYRVIVHPECRKEVVDSADGAGSTRYLWDEVMNAKPGSRIAVATEGHFVRNVSEQAVRNNVHVVNMADVPDPDFPSMGCGCATMSRNDPPHLVAILDLLKQGKAPTHNRVLPGDSVNERTGSRDRLTAGEQSELVHYARLSLENMIAVTEGRKE
jgi:quinolinate synthase